MQKKLPDNIIVKKNSNLEWGVKQMRIFLVLICVFLSSSMFAQDEIETEKEQSTSLIISQGATIYSSDNSFNQQVLSDKINLQHSGDYRLTSEKGKDILIVGAFREEKIPPKDLQAQLKKAEEVKQQETLEKVKKEIARFEEKKKESSTEYDFLPVSEWFRVVSHSSTAYVVPSVQAQDFSVSAVQQFPYQHQKFLEFLHSKKYIHYNSRSLNFCYSKVFSVRPPPVLI